MVALPGTLAEWAALGLVGQVHWGQPARALPYRRLLARQTAQALAVIRQFQAATQGRGYVAVSFGKDSLVAWHLAQQVVAGMPAVWVNQGPLAEWPDCLALKEVLTTQYGMVLHEVQPDRTLYEAMRHYGVPVSAAMSTREDHAINDDLLYRPLRRFQQQGAWRGHLWGLRGVREAHREGVHREILLTTRGLLYQRQDGVWVGSPVGRWRVEHIWAYIDAQGLPYPAMYDLDRSSIRNGSPIDPAALNLGRIRRLHQHFPAIYPLVIAAFPELARYG